MNKCATVSLGETTVYGRRPRMWDPITGLPVPPRVKLRQFWPQADASIKSKFRLRRANDLELLADEVEVRIWLLSPSMDG